MPWYYVIIYGYLILFYFGPCDILLKGHMCHNIIQHFKSLRCMVLEISSFEFDDYRGFRAGAGVRHAV